MSAADGGLSSFVENRFAHSERPELTSAKIIISGGRALGSKEKFEEVMLPIADKLGAAVGPRAPPSMRAMRRTTAGRPDRKVVAPDLLHRGRHFRRHPVSGWP